jgi:hypothetical protein
MKQLLDIDRRITFREIHDKVDRNEVSAQYTALCTKSWNETHLGKMDSKTADGRTKIGNVAVGRWRFLATDIDWWWGMD